MPLELLQHVFNCVDVQEFQDPGQPSQSQQLSVLCSITTLLVTAPKQRYLLKGQDRHEVNEEPALHVLERNLLEVIDWYLLLRVNVPLHEVQNDVEHEKALYNPLDDGEQVAFIEGEGDHVDVNNTGLQHENENHCVEDGLPLGVWFDHHFLIEGFLHILFFFHADGIVLDLVLEIGSSSAGLLVPLVRLQFTGILGNRKRGSPAIQPPNPLQLKSFILITLPPLVIFPCFHLVSFFAGLLNLQVVHSVLVVIEHFAEGLAVSG